MSSSHRIFSNDRMNLSDEPTDFGFLLQSIDSLPENISLNHLMANKVQIANYLSMVSEPQPIEKIIDQPTPCGLALIANWYNEKGDQDGKKIFIASNVIDLQYIANSINQSHAADALVIFQPTDLPYEKNNSFYAIHKVLMYFAKQDDQLNILIADSTPFQFIRETTLRLVDTVLRGSNRHYYFQQMVHIANSKTPIYLQSDYWSCGTHAFRLARIVAKTPDFFESLAVVKTITADDPQKQIIEFTTPFSFLKLADTRTARNYCATLFGNHFTKLSSHFHKYDKDYSYVNQFTRKYTCLITSMLLNKPSSKLHTEIDAANAKYYRSDPSIQLRN